MNEPKTNLTALAQVLARTPRAKEIRPSQWENLTREIVTVAASAGGVFTIYGENGSGRTTFATMLATAAKDQLDVVAVSPASPIAASGWLMNALIPWLSSDHDDTHGVQKKLAGLAENDRSILIAIDGADFILDECVAGDIASLLNLADHCGVRLSVLIAASEDKTKKIIADKRLSGRILLHRRLPGLTTSQILELLLGRLGGIDIANPSSMRIEIEKIAVDCNGNPLIALNLLARKLGAIDSVTSQAPALPNHNKRPLAKIAKTPKTSEAINIEDLLTPTNAGRPQD